MDEGYDLLTDPLHCGGCNQACPADDSVASWACSNGHCVVTACTDGLWDANAEAGDGCEADDVVGQQYWVDSSQPGGTGTQNQPFGTLQEALFEAGDNARIHITGGPYIGPFTIGQAGLSLFATPGTLLTANGAPVIQVTADDVRIVGATLEGGRAGVEFLGESGASLSGGEVRDVTMNLQEASGINATPAAGVAIKWAEGVHVVASSVGAATASKGNSGGDGAGNQGGPAAGVYVVEGDGCRVIGNQFQELVGGIGGDGGQAKTQPGGGGGVAAGVYLDGTSGCVLEANAVSALAGGAGGEGTPTGVGGRGFGVFLDADALDNEVALSNTLDGDAIAYLYGASGTVLSGVTASGSATNWGQIAVFSSTAVTITNATLTGHVAPAGAVVDPHFGESAALGAAIRLHDCVACGVSNSTISGTAGGDYGGGDGPERGGFGAGIALTGATTAATVTGNAIANIAGGAGGGGGDAKWVGGRGGVGAGVLLAGASGATLSNNVITNVSGGAGGLGTEVDGRAQQGFGVYFADSVAHVVDPSNRVDGDPVLHLYGAESETLDGYDTTATSNPTNLGLLSVIASTDVVISNVRVTGYRAEVADSAESGLSGAAGVWLESCTGCALQHVTVTDVRGSDSGAHSGAVGGGMAGGIVLEASPDAVLSRIVVRDVRGGVGGEAGAFGGAFGITTDAAGLSLTNAAISAIGDVVHDGATSSACVRVDATGADLRWVTCASVGPWGAGAVGDGILATQTAIGVYVTDVIVSNVSGTCFHRPGAGIGIIPLTSTHHDCGGEEVVGVLPGEVGMSSADPLLLDPPLDLTLHPNSPAIDSGSGAFDNEPFPNGCQANRGARGNTELAASKVDALHCDPP